MTWTYSHTLDVFSREADRLDVIIDQSSADELADAPDAMEWLTSIAIDLFGDHADDLDRLTR